MENSKERQNLLLLEQYRRCCEDLRHFNDIAWQVPSVAVTISGILLGVAYEFLDSIPRIILLLLNTFMALTMTIKFAKNSLWIEDRTEFMKDIEDYFKVKQLPVETDEILDYLTKDLPQPRRRKYRAKIRWFFGQKGFLWTLSLMLAFSAFLFILSAWEFLNIFNIF